MDSQQDFSEEQKQYLQGFMRGSNLSRVASGLPDLSATLGLSHAPIIAPANGRNGHNGAAPVAPVVEGPDSYGLAAQDRTMSEGKKLTEQEAAKRKTHPLDQWDDIRRHSAEGRFPKGNDVLSFKYYGLFYTAPIQNAYMTRLRFPNGTLRADQMRCVADIAQNYGGGYSHVTTRANLQVREIGASDAFNVLTELHESGIINKGAGADNIRNVTGSATAGIDAQELIDTRPLCREMHHYILNHREMFGLPRKFNIAFDGGGTIHTLEDTNDIGFQAVRVGPGKSVPEGAYFRMMLGGITGHQDFAVDSGILLKPEECVLMAAAIVRVFIDEGDRTDRKKARLKYVLDRMGRDGMLEAARKYQTFEPLRLPLEECEPRPKTVRNAHIGIHPQKQDGLFYIGVVVPVGKLEIGQMLKLAELCERYGSGTLRLTVWQNLLIPDVREADVETVKAELEAIGLHWSATNVLAGLVACTGSFGCKFALSNTKADALAIAEYVEARLQLDQPLNIHVTGCPNSCAQHYIGDIGMMGVKVEVGEDMVDGYHVFVGGGWGENAAVGRLIYPDVVATDVPRLVENMMAVYMEQRVDDEETFVAWTRRHEVEQLKALCDARLVVA